MLLEHVYQVFFQKGYRKIPKISPSMYKSLQIYPPPPPPTRNAKNPQLIAPPNTSAHGGLYLEISLKYKVKQTKNGKFPPTVRLAQSTLKRKFSSVDKPLQKLVFKKGL